MAIRPVFVPTTTGTPLVDTMELEFEWYPGFSKSQAQRSIVSLHQAAAEQNVSPVLEISSKSSEILGVQLSAFNLMMNLGKGYVVCVEVAYQGSKVFERGGPYIDLYEASARDAKRDPRLYESGNLVRFDLLGDHWPLKPETAFYDWLYLNALHQNPNLSQQILNYKGFSDIAFNPERSISCQARSAALYVSLMHRGLLQEALEDESVFLSILSGTKSSPQESPPIGQLSFPYGLDE